MDYCSSQTVKASRKQTICDWCGEAIEVGQPKIHTSGTTDGDFFCANEHPECHEAARQWWRLNYINEDGIPMERDRQRGTIWLKDDYYCDEPGPDDQKQMEGV